MMDSRKMVTKRDVTFTLKLTSDELRDLTMLAEKNCRRPGDQLRHLLRVALANAATESEQP